MYRFAEHNLFAWLQSKSRKPLILRGARQVGKSTLVRMFAQSQNKVLLEINLERYRSLEPIFTSMNVDSIIHEIEVICNRGIADPDRSIIFLDEIQSIPQAIAALRYFYEERPELPVIAAGSLLEFALEQKSFSMPVGRVEYLYLHPMSFEEFLNSSNESHLVDEMRRFLPGGTFSPSAHERLLMLLRDYMFVGGMPAAVKEYLSVKNISSAFAVHDSLIETFRDDFGKYASGRDLDRLQRMFDSLPGQVAVKFKYANVLAHEQPRDVKTALMLLVKAGLVTRICHSPCSGLPLAAGSDERIFKIQLVDVGIFNASMGVATIPPSQLLERSMTTEGKIAEQFIGQHLLQTQQPHRRPSLNYWVREGKTANAEVDFVIQHNGTIIPVEVKAGTSGSLRSLNQFIAEKRMPLALRFDLNPPSLFDVTHTVICAEDKKEAKYKLVSLPLYMVGQWARILSAI